MSYPDKVKGIAAELIVDLTGDEISQLRDYLEFGQLGIIAQAERFTREHTYVDHVDQIQGHRGHYAKG